MKMGGGLIHGFDLYMDKYALGLGLGYIYIILAFIYSWCDI